MAGAGAVGVRRNACVDGRLILPFSLELAALAADFGGAPVAANRPDATRCCGGSDGRRRQPFPPGLGGGAGFAALAVLLVAWV